MPIVRHYTVTGKWPFPTDMLRYDDAKPATDADAKLIERLSGEHSDNGFGLRDSVSINLVMPNDRYLPDDKRWESFGWRVWGLRDLGFRDEAAAATWVAPTRWADTKQALRLQALKKLTPEEREALGL